MEENRRRRQRRRGEYAMETGEGKGSEDKVNEVLM